MARGAARASAAAAKCKAFMRHSFRWSRMISESSILASYRIAFGTLAPAAGGRGLQCRVGIGCAMEIVVATNILPPKLPSGHPIGRRGMVWYAPADVGGILCSYRKQLSQPYACAAPCFSGFVYGMVAGCAGFLSADLLHSGDCG